MKVSSLKCLASFFLPKAFIAGDKLAFLFLSDICMGTAEKNHPIFWQLCRENLGKRTASRLAGVFASKVIIPALPATDPLAINLHCFGERFLRAVCTSTRLIVNAYVHSALRSCDSFLLQ